MGKIGTTWAKWFYLRKSGSIWAKVVVQCFQQTWFYFVKMVLFGKRGSICAKRFHLGKSDSIWAKWLYLGKSGSTWAKWLYLGKMVLFGQKWFYLSKSGCISGKMRLYLGKKIVLLGQNVFLLGQNWFYLRNKWLYLDKSASISDKIDYSWATVVLFALKLLYLEQN